MIPMWKLSGRLGNSMFQYAYLYNQAQLGEIDDVYVQDEKWFEESKEEIRTLFSQGIPAPIDMVAVHVRRGDYCNNPFYVNLMETDYYERAMAEFPDCEFLVFSDDIGWCKQQEIFKNCEFSEADEVGDMNLMSACVGVIMANSSFSWWGAYLSKGKVVAPREWFTDGVERTKLLDNWTVI